jgi:hypothetical protein
VVESTDSDQVSHDDDDADSGGFCGWKQPYHQSDQPTCEDGTYQHRSETRTIVGGTNFCQTLLSVDIEQTDSSQAQSEEEGPNQVCAKYDTPQTKHPQQCG